MRRSPILAALATTAVAVAVAGCGSSGSSSSPSTSASSTTASSSANGYSSGAAPKPTAAAPAGDGASTTVVRVTRGKLGTYLVDASGRTLYLWKADRGMASTCNGDCAQDWPPLTTKGKPTAGTGVRASLLGTTRRSDGSLEVTYGGHPLYYFAGDSAPGQTSGQNSNGFGAEWLVVAPSGRGIDNDDS